MASIPSRKKTEGIFNEAVENIGKLILEELTSINPFPEMEVGIPTKEDACFYESTKKVPGILLRDVGPEHIHFSLAGVVVLKPDGAYCFNGVCLPKGKFVDGYMFNSNFLVRSDAKMRKLYDFEIMKHYHEIFQAIESSKKRSAKG